MTPPPPFVCRRQTGLLGRSGLQISRPIVGQITEVVG